jgi:hypothetical protein
LQTTEVAVLLGEAYADGNLVSNNFPTSGTEVKNDGDEYLIMKAAKEVKFSTDARDSDRQQPCKQI